jgi:hypothetical protein
MNETGLSTFSTPIQYSFGIPSQRNNKRARNKSDSKGKEEVKLSLFADDKSVYLRDPKNSTKAIRNHKLFWQSSRYKISIQKLVAFL